MSASQSETAAEPKPNYPTFYLSEAWSAMCREMSSQAGWYHREKALHDQVVAELGISTELYGILRKTCKFKHCSAYDLRVHYTSMLGFVDCASLFLDSGIGSSITRAEAEHFIRIFDAARVAS